MTGDLSVDEFVVEIQTMNFSKNAILKLVECLKNEIDSEHPTSAEKKSS